MINEIHKRRVNEIEPLSLIFLLKLLTGIRERENVKKVREKKKKNCEKKRKLDWNKERERERDQAETFLTTNLD